MQESKKAYKLRPFKATEHSIQKDCVSWLRAHGFITINTDVMTALGHIPDNTRRIRFIKHYKDIGYTKGQPDLIAFNKDGTALAIEFKSEDGKLSPEQKEMQAKCEESGMMYLVVRDWREMRQQITGEG